MRPTYFFAGLFVLCFLSNTVKAQERLLVDPAKVDSVQKLIDPHPKEDKEKVMLLNEYARLCFYNQEYKKGLIATRDARELSQKMEFEGGSIMYHITLSIFTDGTLDGPFDFDDYQLSEAKIRAFKIGGDTVLARKPGYPNGYPYEASKEMLERLQPSLEYFRALDDKEIQAAILVHYANYYYLNNHLDKFDSLMGQFVALYQKLNMIDPVLLGYTAKLYAAQLLKNETGVESIIQEITNLVSQNKDLTHSGNFQLSQIYFNLKQYVLAIGYLNKSADFFEEVGDFNGLTRAYQEMLRVYRVLGMHSYRADLFERFLPIIKKSGNTNATWLYQDAAWANYNSENYNKAWQYLNYIVDSLPLNDFESRFMKTQKVQLKGQILMDQEKYKEAIPLLYEAYNNYNSNIYQDKATGPWALAHIANCYYQIKQYQSALHYANLCFNTALPADLRLGLKINLQLADIYEALGKEDSAYKYLRKYRVLLEESNNLQNADQILEMQINSVVNKSNEKISRLNQESQLKEQRNKNQQLLIFSIAGALFSAVLILFILYRNNKSKQKANTALEQTLSNLKSAQSQLIQSEKMASLGELTAGIAHEIQNPLNFVNNFSEVNTELIDDASQEIEKGNISDVKSILKNIRDNEEKISHHGKRADAIVKGMLQHSRSSSGTKEPTDINNLTEEYLRLAYHGLRAKDKAFSVELKKDFDTSVGIINIVPQEIGRVILNLINNAFYAVDEKKKEAGDEYEPIVFVSTKRAGSNVLITVEDNGKGIPQRLLDKIFQPFFTTKPVGQGTGLGLSLSYDIVKAHNGDIKVITKEGEGAEFIIQLPKS